MYTFLCIFNLANKSFHVRHVNLLQTKRPQLFLLSGTVRYKNCSHLNTMEVLCCEFFITGIFMKCVKYCYNWQVLSLRPSEYLIFEIIQYILLKFGIGSQHQNLSA